MIWNYLTGLAFAGAGIYSVWAIASTIIAAWPRIKELIDHG